MVDNERTQMSLAADAQLRRDVELLLQALEATASSIEYVLRNHKRDMKRSAQSALEAVLHRCKSDIAALQVEVFEPDPISVRLKATTSKRTLAKVATAIALFMATPPGDDVWDLTKAAMSAGVEAVVSLERDEPHESAASGAEQDLVRDWVKARLDYRSAQLAMRISENMAFQDVPLLRHFGSLIRHAPPVRKSQERLKSKAEAQRAELKTLEHRAKSEGVVLPK